MSSEANKPFLNINKLPNDQLYALIQNIGLSNDIRNAANQELNNRNLSIEAMQEIITKHDQQFVAYNDNGLNIYIKLLIIVCPFFIEIYTLVAGRMLAKGHIKKWKDYKLFLVIGYCFWTLLVILFASYFMRR